MKPTIITSNTTSIASESAQIANSTFPFILLQSGYNMLKDHVSDGMLMQNLAG